MSDDLDLALQPRYWLRCFDLPTLQRARGYANAAHISRLQINIDPGLGLTLEGQVHGNARRPYITSVDVLRRGPNRFDYDTACSCPVAVHCKHAAALLMLAAEKSGARVTTATSAGVRLPSAAPAPAWQRWLDQIPRALPAAAAVNPASPTATHQFAFLLDYIRSGHGSGLLARPVLLQPGKNGRWLRPEPVREPNAYLHVAMPPLDDRDWHLVARLRMAGAHHQDNQHWYPLAGPRGEALLQDMLTAGLCHWRKPGETPLRLGAPRRFAWHWQIAADGTQTLRPELAAGGVLVPVHGEWYVDPSAGELAPVQATTTLPRALLQSVPAVEPEQADAFATAWRAHPLLAALPAPRPLQVERLRCPPRPLVWLGARRIEARARRREAAFGLPLLQLAFDYAGQRLPGPPQYGRQRWLEGDRVCELERDIAAEQQAEARLDTLGFVRLAQHYELRERSGVRADDVYVALDDRAPATLLQARQRVEALREHGFQVTVDPNYPVELIDGAALPWYAAFSDTPGEAWFEGELGIELDGARVSLLPILHAALENKRFPLSPPADEAADAALQVPLDERRVLNLPYARLRALLAPLAQWITHERKLKLPRVAAGVIDELGVDPTLALHTQTSQRLQALARNLRAPRDARPVKLPKSFTAELRAYQRDGVQWLAFLAEHQLGGVLADDMGLGKTVQILAHLAAEKAAKRLTEPALVVAPTSVIGNWVEQARRFAPRLRLNVLHGLDRHGRFESLADCDIALTSYALLPRDRELLLAQRFAVAIFDEAQALKNAKSQAALVARELVVGRRIAVTGTPLENHLGELWAQFDLVLPGLLGDATRFTRLIRTPIEKHADADAQARLNRRIAPFVLRRSKEQVAQELPAKTEIIQPVELGAGQRELYESLRLAMHDKVRAAIERRGLAQSAIVVLDALLKLRQACCDPRLVKLPAAGKVKHSAKLELLLEMLEELFAEGRRILLFSQFTEMLDLIEQTLGTRGHAYARLDGSTRDRDTPIRRFQAGEVPLFLISLKAGGVGLNLTAADTVIHYDPWWNPAVERQATDRAHRIGQDKPVFVYKLIASGTVEEKIQALQQRKAALAQAVLEGGTREQLSFSEEDVEALFGAVD